MFISGGVFLIASLLSLSKHSTQVICLEDCDMRYCANFTKPKKNCKNKSNGT